MIKYYKLFDLMNRRGMKKTELLKIMSSGTLAKLSKGETIKTDIIDKICSFLKCQPEDIMEHIEDITIFEEETGGYLITANIINEFDETEEVHAYEKNKEEMINITNQLKKK